MRAAAIRYRIATAGCGELMDQKRLFFAIAVSLAILLGFQTLIAPHLPKPPAPAVTQTAQTPAKTPATTSATPAPNAAAAEGSPAGAAAAATQAVPKSVPRVEIAAQRLHGSISLLGARLDDLTLTDYRETLAPNSPDVRLLEPRSEPHPYFVQYGWTAAPGESREAARRRHAMDRVGEHADRGSSGDVVLGQRRRPDIPTDPVG